MKITDKRTTCSFDDIEQGEVFFYEGDVYVRICSTVDENGILLNALNLFNYILFAIDGHDEVLQVTAELILEH